MKKPSGNKDSDLTPTAPSGTKPPLIVLQISGRLMSFKTGKRGAIQRGKNGQIFARPFTDRGHAKQMRLWIEDLKSQLRSAMAQEMGQTQTEHAHRCLIASSGPVGKFANQFDDRRAFVRRLVVDWIPVEAGQEGATVTITPL